MFKHSEGYLYSFGASIITAISLEYLNQIFFKDSNEKYIWIPVVIHIVMTFLYIGITFVDFIYGVRVSVKVKNQPYDFYRVIESMAQAFATIIVTSLVMFCCLLITALNLSWVLLTSSLTFAFIWSVIILYQYSSIGNHIKTLYGTKPPVFGFMETISSKMRTWAMNKFEKSFNLTENENKTENEKDNNTDISR
jgi:hypothetical protein